MKSQNFRLGSSPQLTFRSCSANLHIRGWDQELVEITPHNGAQAKVHKDGSALKISTTAPLTVEVPLGTTVAVVNCAGDLHAVALRTVRVQKHHGNLVLHDVSGADLKTVYGDIQIHGGQTTQVTRLYGDLEALAVNGDLSASDVHGNIALKQVNGPITLSSIAGDVSIYFPGKRINARSINGTLELGGIFKDGQYNLEATDNVIIRLGPQSNVHLYLEAPLGRISYNLHLDNVQTSAHKLEGSLGQGTARVRIVSHTGNIKVHQLEDRKHGIEKPDTGARTRQKTRRTRMAETVRRRSEYLAHKARERAARLGRWHVKWGTSQAGVSFNKLESERLLVLKMLAEGKINAEQAEALLRALED